MTADDIFETTCVQYQLLPLNHVQQMLSNKLFCIQVEKSSWISSNVTHTSVTVLSYTEKEQNFPGSIDDNAKKMRPLDTGEVEKKAIATESKSSSADLPTELPSPDSKKYKAFDTNEVEMKVAAIDCESSSAGPSIEPPKG